MARNWRLDSASCHVDLPLIQKNTKTCAPMGMWNIKKMYLCKVRPWEWPQRQKI